MSKDWRNGSSTSIAGFIGVLTAHNHHGESTYQNLTGGNDHWGSADDFVLGFQHRIEAVRFLEQLRERLREYGLELHSEKTRLIQFGRYAAEHRERDGEGKPETFDFLGFKHICGTVYKTGRFTVRRKTIGKRMAAKLKATKAELLRRRHEPVKDTGEWLRAV